MFVCLFVFFFSYLHGVVHGIIVGHECWIKLIIIEIFVVMQHQGSRWYQWLVSPTTSCSSVSHLISFFDCSIKMSWLGMLVYCKSPSLSGVSGIKEVATCATNRPSIISATFYIREQLKCGQSNSKASLLRFL